MQQLFTFLLIILCGEGHKEIEDPYLVNVLKILNGSLFPEISSLLPYKMTQTDVKFLLYTPENTENFIEINRSNMEILENSERPTKIIIHGWRESSRVEWYNEMTKEYLEKGVFNVIQVDWEKPASVSYFASVGNAKDVGTIVGQLILHMDAICNISVESVHIIGHSLGGHVAGFAGKEVSRLGRSKVGRITGLDPAGPLYETVEPSKRLSKSDARIVDIIHTDGGKLGFRQPLGTIDFFPNGGIPPQPGCVPKQLEVFSFSGKKLNDQVGCSHFKSHAFFISSIRREMFPSVKCNSWIDFVTGKCNSNEVSYMGDSGDDFKDKSGEFYLRTTSKFPFSRGSPLEV